MIITPDEVQHTHGLVRLRRGRIDREYAALVEETVDCGAPTYPADGFAVCCLSSDGRPVTAAKGLVLGAHHWFQVDQLISPVVASHRFGQRYRRGLISAAMSSWQLHRSELLDGPPFVELLEQPQITPEPRRESRH